MFQNGPLVLFQSGSSKGLLTASIQGTCRIRKRASLAGARRTSERISKLQAQATEHGTVRPSPEACSMPEARLTARYKSAKRQHSGARSVPEQLPRHSRFGSAVYARAPRHAPHHVRGFRRAILRTAGFDCFGIRFWRSFRSSLSRSWKMLMLK